MATTPVTPTTQQPTTQPASQYTSPFDPLAFQSPGGSGLNPRLMKLDPQNDLRSQQIMPGASIDRFKLAGEQFGTFADSTNSAYQAALRDATRAGAGAGRLGSGMLRTSYGDLANQRTQQLDTERGNLFQNALLGSVQDAQQNYNNLLAQQAFQSGSQNQAFQQGIQGLTLQDQLTNSAFNRAMMQNTAGQANSPYDARLLQSQLLGSQSSAAMQALQGLMSGQSAANAANRPGAAGPTGIPPGFMDWYNNWRRTQGVGGTVPITDDLSGVYGGARPT